MRRIRTKLWLGMMILVGIITILLWLFQIVFLGKFYSVLELKEVTNRSNRIVEDIELLEDIDQTSNSPIIAEAMDKLINEKQLSIEVIDKNYNSIYEGAYGYNTNTPGSMKEVVAEAADNALKGIEFKQEVTHPKFGYQFMIIGLPIQQGSIVKGAMLISLPMASIEDTQEILQKQLIIITGILLIVSAVISFLLSKNFADPISKISRLAESYTSGHYSARIPATGTDEIGQLSMRMNDMGEALERNDLLQKELVANVSHELRTPLTLIRGYAETLRDVTGDNPVKREKQLGVIIEETERLGRIVEDILNLSQLQSGAVSFEPGAFSMNEMLSDIKERYELQQEPRSFKVTGASDLQVYGDKKRIEQVFYNLINNALRHTKEDEPIEVRLTQNTGNVRVEIIDHGEGIAKEDLEHIFERYYKGKRLDGKKSGGTGLGLAIVKSILVMHQVSYGVESDLGKGTTFWFELIKDKSHTSF
ncbi:MAG: signal transduction histidine kinase [Lachnospiraceae bacterium]|nr:signal transduction histidine kinase [Lachnospiraceae bacterium]